MKWSFRLCEINGTQVRVHLTFLLLLAWFGVSFFASAGPIAALSSIAFILLLFTCVVLHEFGHATAARSFGIRTPDITLLPIGGVARLESIPRKPHQELIVAIAGPLVNVFIASALLLILGRLPEGLVLADLGAPANIPMNLLKINFMLVLFNLVPAFPMDGGRMFRAILAMFMGYTGATRAAASLGQILAIFGGLLGIVSGNLFLVLIAIFIFMGAGSEAAFVRLHEATSGLSVSDAMITNFRSLPAGATLQDAVDALIAGSQHDFPVIGPDGAIEGILLRADLIAGLARHGPAHPVSSVLTSAPPSLRVNASLDEAFEILNASASSTLPVVEADGTTLAGIITTENVGEMIMVQSALASRRPNRG